MNAIKSYWYNKVLVFLLSGSVFLTPEYSLQAQVANVTVDIPAPHGGDFGVVAGGFAFQSRTRNTPKGFKPDGNVGVSVGLGNTRKLVGIIANANIYGLSNKVGEKDNFGSGTLDVQLNRVVTDYFFIGAGMRNLARWRGGDEVARNSRSFFVTGNYVIPLHRRYSEPFSLFFITAGLGNGMFRLDRDFTLANSGKLNLFGSVALQVLRGTNLIVEWNGYEINTAISVYPFKKIPNLGGTFCLTDLTEERTRLVISMGYSFRILP
jgi:hypothetical protein